MQLSGWLIASGGVDPDVMAEVFLVEIGKVNRINIGDGMIDQRCFAGKSGNAASAETVIFDVGSDRGVGQLKRMRYAADTKVKGKIADHPANKGWIVSRDR